MSGPTCHFCGRGHLRLLVIVDGYPRWECSGFKVCTRLQLSGMRPKVRVVTVTPDPFTKSRVHRSFEEAVAYLASRKGAR